MKFDFKSIIQILGSTSIFNTNNSTTTSLSIINNNSTTSLQTIGINSGSKMIFSEHNSHILNSIEEKLAIADKKYGYNNTAELDHLEPVEDLAPSLQALFSVEECFKENVIIECPTSSPPILQQPPPIYTYDVDLEKWGYFKVYDAFYNRGYGKVVTSMSQTIAIIGEMFGEEFIHSYPIKKHDCTVDISPPPYVGESGIYTPQNYNDIIHCQIRASSYVNSDYRVLVHEMFHALFNGLLQGKSDSIPRMLTEGFARAAMYYDTEYLVKEGTHFVPGIITKLEGQCNKIFFDMPALFECLKNSYFDNYALGESYFYFCRNTSPNTLPNYIKKIIKEPFKSYYNKHNAGDLIGVRDLEVNCSMDNFKKWLKNPDFTKGSSNDHDVTDELHYIVSICDNGVHKVLVCDKQAQLSTPEEFINKNCSIADGDTHYPSNSRFIFWDSNGNIKVTILEDRNLTFLYKEDNNIIKYICKSRWNKWFKSTMQSIAKYEDCNYANGGQDVISNAIKNASDCELGYPTPEDISLFSDNNNDPSNKDNNSFNTWKIAGIENISLFSDNNNDPGNKDNNGVNTWKIAGIVGGATTLILLGVVGASIYKIQSKKHKATDAESQSRGISGEAEELISPQDLLNALQAKAGPGVTVVKTLKDAKELIEMPVHQEASPIYANLSENSDFEDSDYEIPCIGNQADYAIIIE